MSWTACPAARAPTANSAVGRRVGRPIYRWMAVCCVAREGYAIEMAKEVRLWQVGNGDHLTEIRDAKLDLESRLEEWLARDISVLDPDLLLIGRQVATDGGPLDLLCLNERGDLVMRS
jgi:hypothetical protein